LKILVIPVLAEESLEYREFDGGLDMALASLGEGVGKYGSVQVEYRGSKHILAGIYRPNFDGDRLADWEASVEGNDFDAEAAFEEVLAVDGVKFAILSIEESPEFDGEHVTEQNFPWSDFLLAQAVRGTDGNWIVCRGRNV
jgi:hypothetical protein